MSDERGEPVVRCSNCFGFNPAKHDIRGDIVAAIARIRTPETREQYLRRLADWRVERLFFANGLKEPLRQKYIDLIEATAKSLGLEVTV